MEKSSSSCVDFFEMFDNLRDPIITLSYVTVNTCRQMHTHVWKGPCKTGSRRMQTPAMCMAY